MTRISPFNSPLLLGFDQLEHMLERVSKAAGDGYPPYNIVREGERRLRISLAVAGFRAGDLALTVEQRQLHIRGARQDELEQGVVYLHRGIAARQFERTFLLADDLEVKDARLEDGLLHIALERNPAVSAVRTIAITNGAVDEVEGSSLVGTAHRNRRT
jgi:HSP20 family molecular chaperone IbpA